MAATAAAVITRPIAPEQASLWSDAWRRLRRNRMALISAVYLTLLVVVAIVAIFKTPYSYRAVGVALPYSGPSAANWLGADILGRDVLSRLLVGAQISLIVGVGTQVLVLAVGVPIGLILGNGAFKPNISTQVGLLYPQGDPRRDGAFTIFYMGINLGAFFSPLVCGTLGQRVGWHWGFAAAGVGMIAGLIIYLIGQKHLSPDQLTQRRRAAEEKPVKESLTRDEMLRIGALIVICALNIVFWGVYEQQGNTLQLFADRNTAWPVFGSFHIPTTWYQAFNPAMIFLLAPLLSMFWAWQAKRGKEPSSVTKMGMGCLMLGLAFIILIVASRGMTDTTRLNLMWLTSTTLIFTIGELYLSPIGLSFVTKIAPARMVSMLMGVWFLANFFGNYLNGYLGTFYEKMSREQYFLMLLVLGVSAGVAMLILSRPLDKIVLKHDRGEA